MRQALCSIFVVGLAAFASENATATTKGPAHPHPVARWSHNHPLASSAIRHTVFHPRTYAGWTHYCWLPAHRCYGYYCPTNRVWFYYSSTESCYLPITSIATYPPTPVVNVININGNVAPMSGAPALPSGAVFLPVGVTPPARN